MSKQLLIETWGPIKLSIIESESSKDLLVAEGEFGFCGKPTANGRIYPRKLVEREIGRLRPKMESRGLYGELDHPDDGSTKLKRVSHLITDMRVESDGRVLGKLEVLGTPNGKILRNLIESGAQTGVSSRGVGSVKKNREGNFEVQEDFKLLTYDAVADPAWGEALPEYRFEDEENHGQSVEEGMADIEELEVRFPDLISQIRAEERERASDIYKQRLSEQQRQMESKVAGSLEQVIAGQTERAKLEALEQVKNSPLAAESSALLRIKEAIAPLINESAEIENLTQRIIQLEAANEALQESVEKSEAGRVIQSHLACVPESHQDHFLGLLGPLHRFESFSEFEERVEIIAEEFRYTGRYFDSIEDTAEELAESISLLSEARDALVAKDALLAESKEALIQIESTLLRRSTLLDEAKARIETLQEQVQLSDKSNARLEKQNRKALTAVMDKYEEAVQNLEDKLEESNLNLAKHKSVIGHQSPQRLLNRLEEATSVDRVNKIVEAEQHERKPIEVPTGPTSNGTRDPLNEEHIRQRISAVMNANPVGGASTHFESRSQSPSGGAGRFEIPGLSPNKMKQLTESAGNFLPGD